MIHDYMLNISHMMFKVQSHFRNKAKKRKTKWTNIKQKRKERIGSTLVHCLLTLNEPRSLSSRSHFIGCGWYAIGMEDFSEERENWEDVG